MILQELNRFAISTIISPWRDVLRVYSHGEKRLLPRSPAHHHVPSSDSAETTIWLMPLFKQTLFFFLLSRREHLAAQKRGREFKQIISTLLFIGRMEIC